MSKKLENKILRAISNKAYEVSQEAANSKCIFYAYQKELPQKVKELKK